MLTLEFVYVDAELGMFLYGVIINHLGKQLVRIVYSSDVHGNELVWLKFLRAIKDYSADIGLMNGDLTGKKIIPIAKMKDGSWATPPGVFGREWRLKDFEEVKNLAERIRHAGMYPFLTTYEEVIEISRDPKKQDELFKNMMVESIERWLQLALEKVDLSKARIIINPGNDDIFEIDPIIKKYEEETNGRITYPLDKVVWLDDKHPMISCEWVNPTPWNTPREEPEDKLKKRLDQKFKMVDEYENLVCNFHCPPFDSGLDMAPKLDKNLKPILIGGHPVMIPVGSTAVRKVVEEYQPLIGLHSHIHESPGEVYIGRTLCINPGSEYDQGVFRAYIFDLEPTGIGKHWRTYG
jgi:Icc-related predicted phosphoesterase